MKLLILLGLCCLCVYPQAYRTDPTPVLTTAGGSNPPAYPALLAVPFASISVCNYPGNGLPCTNYATSYTDASGSISCPTSAPVTWKNSNICEATADAFGNFGFWLGPGNYSYTISSTRGNFGPYPLSIGGGSGGTTYYTPTFGALPITPLTFTQYLSASTIDIRSLGATPNNSSFDNYTIIQNAVNQAAVQQICDVTVPAGIWWISHSINVPMCVNLHGTSSFGEPTEYGGPQYGSVLEAMSSFTGPTYGPNGVSSYPSHFMLMIDGSDSLIGYPSSTVTQETDTYSAQASYLTVSCNGVANCSGLFKGHANEGSIFHDLLVDNFSAYGYWACGGGSGGAGPGGNTPCGPNSGDNGGGPDYNIQLTSYGSWVTSSTWPAVFIQDFSRGIHDWTINTSPGPQWAVYAEIGPNMYMQNVHIESTVNGVWVGPSSGFCATLTVTPHCNGVNAARIEGISMDGAMNGSSSAGSVVRNDLTTNTSYFDITYNGGGAMANTFYDSQNSKSVTTAFSHYLGWYYTNNTGANFNPDYGMNVSGPINSTSFISILSNQNPQFGIQYSVSPNAYHTFYQDAVAMHVGAGGGGTGNPTAWQFENSGEVLGVKGISSDFQGASMQAIVGINSQSSVNALFSSNLYYSTANNVFTFGNVGGFGGSALWGSPNGGMGIFTTNGSQPGSVSLSQFLSGTNLWQTAGGHTIIGANAAAQTDTGQSLQVDGNAIVTGPLSLPLYTFTQTPGGTLTASTPATITLPSGIWGLAGADTNHYLYISGGTGTAEAVLVTGGTYTTSAGGTVTFTPTNSHSGAWTLQSATAGVQETLNQSGVATVPPGTYQIYATITPPALSTLRGAGEQASILNFNSTSTKLLNIIHDRFTLSGLALYANATGSSGNYAIWAAGTGASPAGGDNYANIHDVFIFGGFYVGIKVDGVGLSFDLNRVNVAGCVSDGIQAYGTVGYWNAIVSQNGSGNGLTMGLSSGSSAGNILFTSNIQTYNNEGWGVDAIGTVYISGGDTYLNNDKAGEFHLHGTYVADGGYLADANIQFAGASVSWGTNTSAPGVQIDSGTSPFTMQNLHVLSCEGNCFYIQSPSAKILNSFIVTAGVGAVGGNIYGVLASSGCVFCTVSGTDSNAPFSFAGNAMRVVNNNVSLTSNTTPSLLFSAGTDVILSDNYLHNAGSANALTINSGVTYQHGYNIVAGTSTNNGSASSNSNTL